MELLRKVVDGAGHLQAVVAILQQRAPELRNFIAADLFVKGATVVPWKDAIRLRDWLLEMKK
jgi:hypothetical protein